MFRLGLNHIINHKLFLKILHDNTRAHFVQKLSEVDSAFAELSEITIHKLKKNMDLILMY